MHTHNLLPLKHLIDILCRLEVGENIEDNKKNLQILTQRIFDVIVASSERSVTR